MLSSGHTMPISHALYIIAKQSRECLFSDDDDAAVALWFMFFFGNSEEFESRDKHRTQLSNDSERNFRFATRKL